LVEAIARAMHPFIAGAPAVQEQLALEFDSAN
jgi:hypothetical protein